MNSLQGKKIVLGITGSIAAYKACYIIRALNKRGAEVQVVITPAGKEFITTERAKGLPMPFIMKRHVLPNALVPVITMLGTFFGAILGGSVIIEDMFSIPGLGSYVLAAI